MNVTNLEQRVGGIDTFRYTVAEGWIRTRRSSSVPLDSPQVFGSCATAAQRRADAESCIHKISPKAPVKLPKFDALPLSLRCMPSPALKALLIEVAATSNCEIIGVYPDAVLLMPKDK